MDNNQQGQNNSQTTGGTPQDTNTNNSNVPERDVNGQDEMNKEGNGTPSVNPPTPAGNNADQSSGNVNTPADSE